MAENTVVQETHTLIATIGDTDNGNVFSGQTFDQALARLRDTGGWALEPGNLLYTGEIRNSENMVLGQRVLAVLTRYVNKPAVADIRKGVRVGAEELVSVPA